MTFEKHFSEAERDADLKATLTKPKNLSGILNWCIGGLWLIDELGFNPPASVLAATDVYRMDSDKFMRFLMDEFVREPNAETQLSAAFDRFKEWCEENGFQTENNKNFKAGISMATTVRKKRLASMSSADSPVMTLEGYRLVAKNVHTSSRWRP